MTTKRHHVVIIGSGFGGLFSAKALKHADVDVTLIARTTHHLFQPLLYQVATGVLSEGEIAPATREILRHQKNAQVLLGLVDDVDLATKVVKWRFHDEYQETPYDSLIVATGAGQSYFGNDQFAKYAPGMKTIDDALEVRARIFNAFEVAEFTKDAEERRALLTFVVVGAGPTGVEIAGQIRELAAATLRKDFRSIDPASARVILVDGADQVLPPFGPKLGKSTKKKLESLGVEVQLNSLVTNVDEGGIEVKRQDGTTDRIDCFCKVWAAGVQGSSLGKTLSEQSGVELDRTGRVRVQPDLSLPGNPDVFVIGDLMSYPEVPGMAQGAIQSGRHAADIIKARMDGKEHPGQFKYFDKGSMATVAKYSGVAMIGPIKITGFIAWLAWLFLHLLYIAGFKQRVSTLLSWTLSFVTNGRSQRVVTNQQLVGRLAIEELGSHSSGRLIRGTVPGAVKGSADDAKKRNTLKE